MPKPFEEIKEHLERDGSFRDFYIKDTCGNDWNRFLKVVPSIAEGFVFFHGNRELPLPDDFNEIMTMFKEELGTLSITVASKIVNCHFYAKEEIELDFQPEDFQKDEDWNRLLAFFQAIVNAIGKPGIITYENMQDWVIDKILPNNG